VERVLDEKDHRIIRIILTPEGRMNKKISLPRNFPWFLNTDINVIVYYAFTVDFSLSNFAMEKNYTQLDPIKLCENYYEIPFLNPNIKILIQ